MALADSHSLSTRRLASSVSISNRPDDLSPDHLPVRASRPFFRAARRQLFRGRSRGNRSYGRRCVAQEPFTQAKSGLCRKR
jgi:hypothetical protein